MISGLPYDAEIAYLESTGTQYIDTGVKKTSGTTIDCTFSLAATNTKAVFGARTGAANSDRLALFAFNSNFRFDADSQKYLYTPDITSKFRFQYDGTNAVLTNLTTGVVDTQAVSIGEAGTVNIVLFGVSTNGEISAKLEGRIYSFKLWQNGVLVRDLIPVRVGSGASAVGYMYDRVSRRLFGNAGSGAFTLGPDKAVPILSLHRYASPSNGFALGKMGCTDLLHRITAKDYVQNGLVAMWDGIENAGWGVHDASATTWKDLIGENDLVCHYAFNDNSVVCTGYNNCSRSSLSFGVSSVVCIEGCFTIPTVITNNVYVKVISNTRLIAVALPSRGGISLWNGKRGFGTLPSGFNSMSISYGESDIEQLVLNGQIKSRDERTDTWNPYESAIFIGSRNTSTQGFVGRWHSLRIYSRVLTPAEIARNYAIDKARFNLP